MNITWNLQKGQNINPLAHWGKAPALPFHQGMEAYKPTPLQLRLSSCFFLYKCYNGANNK